MSHATEALAKLNALPRRKGQTLEFTEADLMTLEQVMTRCGKNALLNWHDDSVFIETGKAVALYRALTPSGRRALAWSEILGGWFWGDGEGDCDLDGEYCSTPCHSDDVPTIEDFADALEDCSRGGVLFIYA